MVLVSVRLKGNTHKTRRVFVQHFLSLLPAVHLPVQVEGIVVDMECIQLQLLEHAS